MNKIVERLWLEFSLGVDISPEIVSLSLVDVELSSENLIKKNILAALYGIYSPNCSSVSEIDKIDDSTLADIQLAKLYREIAICWTLQSHNQNALKAYQNHLDILQIFLDIDKFSSLILENLAKSSSISIAGVSNLKEKNNTFVAGGFNVHSGKKLNLFFFTSITELIVIKAILESEKLISNSQVCLVFYGHKVSVPRHLEFSVIEIINKHFLGFQFINLFGLYNLVGSYESSLQTLGFNFYDECDIYISKINGSIEREIISQLSPKTIKMFDNGIISFLDIPTEHSAEKSDCNKTLIVENAKLCLVDTFYFSFSGYMPYPNYTAGKSVKLLSKSVILSTLLEIKNSLVEDSTLEIFDESFALIVGSSFSRVGGISVTEEHEAYTLVIDELLQKGYKVVFKPHHREKILLNLDKFDNRVKIINEDYPLELLGTTRKVKFVVSISSTAVFLFNYLFDIPGYYIPVNGIDLQRFPHVKFVREFFKSTSEIEHCRDC